MKRKNPAAVALGLMAKGKPKNFTPDDLERRRNLMNRINELRARRNELETSTRRKLTTAQSLAMIAARESKRKKKGGE